jgi:hypothetical protein
MAQVNVFLLLPESTPSNQWMLECYPPDEEDSFSRFTDLVSELSEMFDTANIEVYEGFYDSENSFVLYTEAKEVSNVDFQECHVRRKGTWYYHGSSIFLHYTDGCTSWNTGSTDTLTVDSIIGNRVYLKGQYCRIFKSNNE